MWNKHTFFKKINILSFNVCLTVRPVCFQGLLEMEFALPTDSTDASGMSLLRRLWVARFDVEEEGQALAEKYVTPVPNFLQTVTDWKCLTFVLQPVCSFMFHSVPCCMSAITLFENLHFNHSGFYIRVKTWWKCLICAVEKQCCKLASSPVCSSCSGSGSLWVWSWSLRSAHCWSGTSLTTRKPSALQQLTLCRVPCPSTETSLPRCSASSLSSTIKNFM